MEMEKMHEECRKLIEEFRSKEKKRSTEDDVESPDEIGVQLTSIGEARKAEKTNKFQANLLADTKMKEGTIDFLEQSKLYLQEARRYEAVMAWSINSLTATLMNISPIDMWNMAQELLPKINVPIVAQNGVDIRNDPTQDSQHPIIHLDNSSDGQIAAPQNSQDSSSLQSNL